MEHLPFIAHFQGKPGVAPKKWEHVRAFGTSGMFGIWGLLILGWQYEQASRIYFFGVEKLEINNSLDREYPSQTI